MRRDVHGEGPASAVKTNTFVTRVLVGLVDDGRASVSPVQLENGRRYIGIDYGGGQTIACLELTDQLRETFAEILPESWQ